MSGGEGQKTELARQGRVVAIVIAATVMIWMGVQFLGGQLGLPTRFAFLADLAALAALFWALVVTWQIWRSDRER